MNTVQSIRDWFERAWPIPEPKDTATSLGVHLEEVSEMLEALIPVLNPTLLPVIMIHGGLDAMASSIKSQRVTDRIDWSKVDRTALLDSLCDQVVTCIGLAHTLGLDIVEGLKEVDASNWSKFEGGKPLFNPNGKIMKGPNYVAPSLDKFT